MKDFDGWNIQKKNTQDRELNRWCRKRDIWWCTMGVNVGFEQDGKGTKFLRPVVVLRSFGFHTAFIVPLSTSSKKNPFYLSVGPVQGQNAFAILTQVRLIDTKRLVEKVGKLDNTKFKELKEAIKALL
jgi:mRNA interferase MazF